VIKEEKLRQYEHNIYLLSYIFSNREIENSDSDSDSLSSSDEVSSSEDISEDEYVNRLAVQYPEPNVSQYPDQAASTAQKDNIKIPNPKTLISIPFPSTSTSPA
jgi:hypothetical protein